MDLRPYVTSPAQMAHIKELTKQGQLVYQPFIFSDTLETGVGYEFVTGREGAGLVYWPDAPQELRDNPHMKRFLIDNRDRAAFSDANLRLRNTYDHFVDTICDHVGDVSKSTFADVGCWAGYFPVSFARRGARLSAGLDSADCSESFRLLNGLLGTNAVFRRNPYNIHTGAMETPEEYDVVVSMMVVCHIGDVLRLLAALGGMARRAFFIWTLVTDDPNCSITFGQPNRHFKTVPFPHCFDDMVRPSTALLRKSLELMGFARLIDVPAKGLPDLLFQTRHRAILALR